MPFPVSRHAETKAYYVTSLRTCPSLGTRFHTLTFCNKAHPILNSFSRVVIKVLSSDNVLSQRAFSQFIRAKFCCKVKREFRHAKVELLCNRRFEVLAGPCVNYPLIFWEPYLAGFLVDGGMTLFDKVYPGPDNGILFLWQPKGTWVLTRNHQKPSIKQLGLEHIGA